MSHSKDELIEALLIGACAAHKATLEKAAPEDFRQYWLVKALKEGDTTELRNYVTRAGVDVDDKLGVIGSLLEHAKVRREYVAKRDRLGMGRELGQSSTGDMRRFLEIR